MAHYEYVHVELYDARHLADLNGIATDLRTTLDLIRYLKKAFENDDFISEVVDAFSTAILVRYSRTFSTGKRHRLDVASLQCWTANEKKHHEHYMAFRSKHIAHSVNEFEDNQVVANFNRERINDDGFASISVQHARMMGLSTLDLEKIENLCRKLISYLDDEMNNEKERVLSIVRSKPVDEILTVGVSVWNPNMKDVDKARRK